MAAAAANPADEKGLFSSQSPMAAAAATPADEKGSFSYQSPMAAAAATPAHEKRLEVVPHGRCGGHPRA